LHAELHRVFTRRDNAKTFQKRVVVELDEPGRVREISDAELPQMGTKFRRKSLHRLRLLRLSKTAKAAMHEIQWNAKPTFSSTPTKSTTSSRPSRGKSFYHPCKIRESN